MISIGSLITIPSNILYYESSLPLMTFAVTNVPITGIVVDLFTQHDSYNPDCRYNLVTVLLDEGLFFVYAEDLVCT